MRHVSVQQLSAFVDGALVGVSRELVTRHLAACAACRLRQGEWSGNDAALRRVLSWEPDERVFEEWSSRVEMTITAERKGLPPPEFSELHHPVIAPAHEPDVGRLNSAVESAQRARRGEAAPAPPPAPAPPAAMPAKPAATPLKPVATTPPAPTPRPAAKPKPRAPESALPAAIVTPVPELASPPRSIEAPPPPSTPVQAVPAEPIEPIVFAPPPAPRPEPAPPPPPPPPMVASEPPRPSYVPLPEPVTAASRASGNIPPWSEVALPEPPPATPSARLRAYERSLRQSAPAYSPYETLPEERPRWRGRAVERTLLAVLSVILLVLLAGSPLVPEVIRIPLPERWSWRLPRVEFVRHGKPRHTPVFVGADMTQLATRQVAEPEIVPPKPIPVPVESTKTDTMAAAPEKPSSLSIVTPRSGPPKKAKRKIVREPEPEPEVLAWPESPGTIIPTRVTTTVTTANEPPVPAKTPVLGEATNAPPRPTPPAESEEDWPLLCGTVLDAAGAPVEGALVVLPANTLTVRTDHRGRFCVSCPPGTHDLRVDAPGQKLFTRTVELSTGMLEITIDLKPAP